VRLEDAEDLVTSDEAHLRNAVRVTESNTNLRGSQTLASKLDNVLNDIIGSCLEPARGSATVREGRRGCDRIKFPEPHNQDMLPTNALAGSVHTTHDGFYAAN
jgi:hypothetical protein